MQSPKKRRSMRTAAVWRCMHKTGPNQKRHSGRSLADKAPPYLARNMAILHGVFVALFTASGLLFRHASLAGSSSCYADFCSCSGSGIVALNCWPRMRAFLLATSEEQRARFMLPRGVLSAVEFNVTSKYTASSASGGRCDFGISGLEVRTVQRRAAVSVTARIKFAKRRSELLEDSNSRPPRCGVLAFWVAFF
jgi:hypothetical protein